MNYKEDLVDLIERRIKKNEMEYLLRVRYGCVYIREEDLVVDLTERRIKKNKTEYLLRVC